MFAHQGFGAAGFTLPNGFEHLAVLVLRDGIIVNDIRQQPEAAHAAHALSGGTHDPGH